MELNCFNKESISKPKTHDRLQADCYGWHVDLYPNDVHLLHANLSNSVGGFYGSHNTAIGVRKGRADLQWFYSGRLFLFEFKVGSDRQKPRQRDFQEANELQGAFYFIIRSEEEYKRLVAWIKCVPKLSDFNRETLNVVFNEIMNK